MLKIYFPRLAVGTLHDGGRNQIDLRLLGLIGLTFLLTGCTSGSLPDLQNAIINISNSYGDIWRLVTGAGYLMGFAFIFRAIYILKIYGEMRTMMSGQANLKGAILCLVVGTALIFSPTLYQDLLMTTFAQSDTSPLRYDTSFAWGPNTYFAILNFVRIIGVVSFIRGWIMLSRLGSHNAQSSFGKAITHIIGGLLAINVQGSIDLWNNTVGNY